MSLYFPPLTTRYKYTPSFTSLAPFSPYVRLSASGSHNHFNAASTGPCSSPSIAANSFALISNLNIPVPRSGLIFANT